MMDKMWKYLKPLAEHRAMLARTMLPYRDVFENGGKMQAGRELDALVAGKVMGMLPPEGKRTWWGLPGAEGGSIYPPPYSTDIATAWRVFEWLRNERSNVTIVAANGWGVHAWNVVFEDDQMNDYDSPVHGYADTAPMAICLAALQAVGVEIGA